MWNGDVWTPEPLELPAGLDCIETYQFVGFTEETAKKLQAKRRPHESPQDVVRDWIEYQCYDVDDVTGDWDRVMRRIGIKDQVRLPMLKREHQMILSTQSLFGWLLEITNTFFDYLEEPEAEILSKLCGSRPCLRKEDQEPESTVPQTPEGHVAIFKSVEGRQMKRCIQDNSIVQSGYLMSSAIHDFHYAGGLYFTHQLWVAEAYSKLMGDACSVADRRTLEVHVPLSHFEKIKTWDLPYGGEWKQFVWHSRRSKSLPKQLSNVGRQYGCIQTPMAYVHNQSITKLDSWEQIERKHIMTKKVEKDGKTQTLVATQLVWMDDLTIIEFEEAVVRKSYIRPREKGSVEVGESRNGVKLA
jgi:hypothetical protein